VVVEKNLHERALAQLGNIWAKSVVTMMFPVRS
jgi:hypothetical protein